MTAERAPGLRAMMEEKSRGKVFIEGKAKILAGHVSVAAKHAMAVQAIPIRMEPRTWVWNMTL